MGNLIKEFKTFAVKGNVTDLAIGVVIGSAFGKIVTSLVNDIIMPLLGLVIGKVNFGSLKIVFSGASAARPELALNYGSFIQSVIDFLIITFSIFLAIKVINELRKRFERQDEIKAPAHSEAAKTHMLLEEIRDLLKEKHKNLK